MCYDGQRIRCETAEVIASDQFLETALPEAQSKVREII
jgi:hypothetical protein